MLESLQFMDVLKKFVSPAPWESDFAITFVVDEGWLGLENTQLFVGSSTGTKVSFVVWPNLET